mgnify:CR=1
MRQKASRLFEQNIVASSWYRFIAARLFIGLRVCQYRSHVRDYFWLLLYIYVYLRGAFGWVVVRFGKFCRRQVSALRDRSSLCVLLLGGGPIAESIGENSLGVIR